MTLTFGEITGGEPGENRLLEERRYPGGWTLRVTQLEDGHYSFPPGGCTLRATLSRGTHVLTVVDRCRASQLDSPDGKRAFRSIDFWSRRTLELLSAEAERRADDAPDLPLLEDEEDLP